MKAVTQEHIMGYGVSCFAFVMGVDDVSALSV